MANIDQQAERAMQLFGVPGLALAVVREGKIALARGYGNLAVDHSAAIDEHSLFAIASISKTFTATALAMLVDAGQLRWDNRVKDHLPDFQAWDGYVSHQLRVRDLLIHNSGLPEVSGGTIWYGSDLSRVEVIRRLRYLHPVTDFRSSFAYQNVTFLVAGQILEAVSGLSWDDFVRTRLLDPLGMRRSTTGMAALAGRENIAQPHLAAGEQVRRIAARDHDNIGPAASMYASAVDLAEYARLHLAGGAWAGQRLFSAERSAELFSPQTPIPPRPNALPGWILNSAFNSYGMGWYVREARGEKVVSHSGGVDGYRTLLTLVPERGLAVVVLTNSETALTHALTAHILAGELGDPEQGTIDGVHAAFRAAQQRKIDELQRRDGLRQPGTRPSLPLGDYTGRYFDPLVDFITVTDEGGQLVLHFAHTPAFTADLQHWHYDTFRLVWRDTYIPAGLVTFPLDSRGRVSRLVFDQPALLDVDFTELNPVYHSEVGA